jgi:hypothetical protein
MHARSAIRLIDGAAVWAVERGLYRSGDEAE